MSGNRVNVSGRKSGLSGRASALSGRASVEPDLVSVAGNSDQGSPKFVQRPKAGDDQKSKLLHSQSTVGALMREPKQVRIRISSLSLPLPLV